MSKLINRTNLNTFLNDISNKYDISIDDKGIATMERCHNGKYVNSEFHDMRVKHLEERINKLQAHCRELERIGSLGTEYSWRL